MEDPELRHEPEGKATETTQRYLLYKIDLTYRMETEIIWIKYHFGKRHMKTGISILFRQNQTERFWNLNIS